MDTKLTIPWKLRLRYLYWATRYTPRGFSMLIGISQPGLKSLYSGKTPSLYQIRRIRLLERIFADELTNFKRLVQRYGLKHAKSELVIKEHEPYAGRITRTTVRRFGRPAIPTKDSDIQALGGMETIRSAAGIHKGSSTSRTVKGPDRHYTREQARLRTISKRLARNSETEALRQSELADRKRRQLEQDQIESARQSLYWEI